MAVTKKLRVPAARRRTHASGHTRDAELAWTCLPAVGLDLDRRGGDRLREEGRGAGTWLESHFRWQIRTFWWGLLWGVIGG